MKWFLKYCKWYAKTGKWWIVLPCGFIILLFYPDIYVRVVVTILLIIWFIGWYLNRKEKNGKENSPPTIQK